jgi:nicotinamide riboside transporter PnuC
MHWTLSFQGPSSGLKHVQVKCEKNLIALVIGVCVCKNFFILSFHIVHYYSQVLQIFMIIRKFYKDL